MPDRTEKALQRQGREIPFSYLAKRFGRKNADHMAAFGS